MDAALETARREELIRRLRHHMTALRRDLEQLVEREEVFSASTIVYVNQNGTYSEYVDVGYHDDCVYFPVAAVCVSP